MKPNRADQLLAGFADGDAISTEARKLREIIRSFGIKSEIFVPGNRIGTGVTNDCLPIEEYHAGSQDIVIYHYSISSSVSLYFENSQAYKIIRYHNITPSKFFEGFDDHLAKQLRIARSDLYKITKKANQIWAVSEYNATELRELNIKNISVMPLFFSLKDFGASFPNISSKFDDTLTNLLFVGRIVPNKCIEELILSFAWYNKSINSHSRLILVGSERSCPRYYAMLRMLSGQLNLQNVSFEGFLHESRLSACYKAADVFISTSRHEGFCLPLIEAMSHGVPVITRMSGGMPEAMGNSGVLFDDIDPRVMAELINKIITNKNLCNEILESQSRRIIEIEQRDIYKDCQTLLGF